MSQRLDVPHVWARRGLVVLAGAGISMAAPAAVPSWWGFNQAVLEGLRRTYTASLPVPVRARSSLKRLSLEAVDITEFSQLVHNAFAGLSWFELLGVLDGIAPNTTHRTLASLAASDVLRAVVTTNFDTLLERALPAATLRVDPLLDEPPVGHRPVLVKLHGTAGAADSLIDLAEQKHRGFSPVWRQWLTRAFSEHCVLVLGFSGADLDLGDDYLGLRQASERTPWLGWNVRAGASPHPRAAEIVTACGSRGHFVDGELPDLLAEIGVPLHRVDAGSVNADNRLTTAIEAWLSQPHVDPATCGIALERVLDVAGVPSAAQALRSSIRTRTRRELRVGLNLAGTTRASLVLGQLGVDDEDPARAMKDLDLAERALDAVVEHLCRRDGLPESAKVEYALDKSGIAHTMAYRCLQEADVPGAQRHLDRALAHIDALPGPQRMNRLSAHLEYAAAIAWLSADTATARALFTQSHSAAVAAGNRQRMTSTEANLRQLGVSPSDRQPSSSFPSALLLSHDSRTQS